MMSRILNGELIDFMGIKHSKADYMTGFPIIACIGCNYLGDTMNGHGQIFTV